VEWFQKCMMEKNSLIIIFFPNQHQQRQKKKKLPMVVRQAAAYTGQAGPAAPLPTAPGGGRRPLAPGSRSRPTTPCGGRCPAWLPHASAGRRRLPCWPDMPQQPLPVAAPGAGRVREERKKRMQHLFFCLVVANRGG
jgi:hypothetical protein